LDEKIAKIQKICETTLKDIKKHKKRRRQQPLEI